MKVLLDNYVIEIEKKNIIHVSKTKLLSNNRLREAFLSFSRYR